MTKLSKYKKWLIKQMRLKIKATKIIRTWQNRPSLLSENTGFINALEVMIAFVEQVTEESLRIHPKKGGE